MLCKHLTMELHPKQGPTQAPGFPFSDGHPALVPMLVRQALSRPCCLPSPVPSCIFFYKYFCHLNILVLSFVSFDMILLLLLFIIFVSNYLLKIRLGFRGYPPKSFSCGNELGLSSEPWPSIGRQRTLFLVYGF